MRLRAIMFSTRLCAPYGHANALPEPSARVAAAWMLGEYIDAIESRRCFHAAILARWLRPDQYDG